ncbi:MAG: hypothetical protein IPK02_14185 [Candidatus Accumulibacter sp.]|uniref:Uncharacterized protein n=1 Tax=Candidatus Accumulibacter affinis TaxID=2954384 RepID=A0A935W4C9_9PROT|nr:hypothetical protein [Candidatus Accumulibacter affinis]
MTDNGAAMLADETVPAWLPGDRSSATLPYSPYQNAKQGRSGGVSRAIDGRWASR